MQVPRPSEQHGVMIEAVENHMPQVIVIDEIGTELEAQAARTIAERGVQLIGTAHGNSLENLMLNPTLSDLIGGIQSVTLSDEEARRRGTQKSVLERKAPPTFTMLVEIQDRDRVALHRDIGEAVDGLLRGSPLGTEVRHRRDDGEIESWHDDGPQPGGDSSRQGQRRPSDRSQTGGRGPQRGPRGGAGTAPQSPTMLRAVDVASAAQPGAVEQVPGADGPAEAPPAGLPKGRGTAGKPVRFYPFGVSRNRLEQAITALGVSATITRDLRDADLVMTLKNYYRRRPQQLQEAESLGKPVYVLRSNTGTQMETVLAGIFGQPKEKGSGGRSAAGSSPARAAVAESAEDEEPFSEDMITNALFEAETAATTVMDVSRAILADAADFLYPTPPASGGRAV
jgi:hypothetical protein